MKNLVLIISYDGSAFDGFYALRNSIFEKIDIALKSIGIFGKLKVAGRTDKGVHALNQVISIKAKIYFDLSNHLGFLKIKNELNKKLFPHILVKKVFLASLDFHPRFSPKYRIYKYFFYDIDSKKSLDSNLIYHSSPLPPFFNNYIFTTRVRNILNIKRALKEFEGVHDFDLFKKSGSQKPSSNSIRQIYKANIFPFKLHNFRIYCINIVGNSFLRSQVRLMIGAIFCL